VNLYKTVKYNLCSRFPLRTSK